jgi:DNA-binding transcriptional LysR family regulator
MSAEGKHPEPDRKQPDLKQPDWEHLKSLLAFSRGGSLAGAARLLGVDQTTISRRLSLLEDRLGERLLNRHADGLSLTDCGAAAVEAARRMENAALDFTGWLTDRKAELTGTVRLTSVEMIVSRLLAPALPRLAAQHPGLTLELVADNRSYDLMRRDADLALRLARPTGPDLIARRLGHFTYGLYANQQRAEDWAQQPTPAAHPLVLADVTLDFTPEALWLAEVGCGAPIAARLSSLTGQMAAVAAGIGLACLPDRFARETPGLVRLCDTPVTREIWLALAPDITDSPRVRAVVTWLAEIFPRQP